MADKETRLPIEVKNRILRGCNYSPVERDNIFNNFFTKFIKFNPEEFETFQKSILNFEKISDKKLKPPVKTNYNKKLTYRQRKELGLYTFGKKSLKYKDFLPLKQLWEDYMAKYVNLTDLKKQKWNNDSNDVKYEQLSLKLYRADYHGSEMTVIKSSCPSYVGKSGIVAMETKNCFKLLGKDNLVRTIPKAYCLFKFELGDFEFTFLGKNLLARPSERSNKKLKRIYTSELQL